MKKIKLTQGKFALVDDSDYEELLKYKWYYSKIIQKRKHTKDYIYELAVHKDKKGKTLFRMSRLLMGFPPKSMMVDHIDHNTLNNQKSNLRLCTNKENQMNRGKNSNTVSPFKGIRYYKRMNQWLGQIQVEGKKLHLGCFKKAEDAAKAYDKAAIKYYGEFAQTNFPQQKHENNTPNITE